MNKSYGTIKLTLRQRVGRAIIALAFVLWHAYVAMLVLAEAMVNRLAQINPRLAQALEVTFGSAIICSVLLFVGVWPAGGSERFFCLVCSWYSLG